MKLTVELAGVPMEVTCRHEENAAFLAAYRTERAPVFSVEPGEEDLIRAREALKRQKEKEGIPGARFADRFVENNALHALICEKSSGRGCSTGPPCAPTGRPSSSPRPAVRGKAPRPGCGGRPWGTGSG